MHSYQQFVSILLCISALHSTCYANLATGRASLRPSAGKRSHPLVVGRAPAYFHLASKQDDDALSCNVNTMSMLNTRYAQLQEEMEEIMILMETCEYIRNQFGTSI